MTSQIFPSLPPFLLRIYLKRGFSQERIYRVVAELTVL